MCRCVLVPSDVDCSTWRWAACARGASKPCSINRITKFASCGTPQVQSRILYIKYSSVVNLLPVDDVIIAAAHFCTGRFERSTFENF